jgi:Beta-propeller repeat
MSASSRAVPLRRHRPWKVVGCWLLAAAGAALCNTARAATPVRFEPNRGQWDPGVRFMARGRGHGLALTDHGATLALVRTRGGGIRRAPPAFEQATVTMRLSGARAVAPVGLERLPGTSSYFIGRDPARWASGVEGFARARYGQPAPGIDLVFYGAPEGRLEYDLVLAPGVEPATVGLVFEGAESLRIEGGDAVVALPGGGQLRQPPPVAYQDDGARRTLVQARYLRRGDGTLGFQVGPYDRRRALVIDPALVYSTYLGGSSSDAAFGVAADAAGNAYVTGYTASANFPVTGAGLPHAGNVDLFISKVSPSGALLYSTYLGGSGEEVGLGIAVDATGSAYVTGYTGSSDFPVVSAFQATRAGGADVFVAKVNPAGSALVYSTYLGGVADDLGQGIAVDAAGRAYVTGQTFSSGFPRSAPLQGTFGGERDAFVTKLASAGNALLYSTFLGGSFDDFGQAIAVDGSGNAYVGGYTFSPDFPTAAALKPTGAAGFFADAFVSKINGAGLTLVYSTYLGGSADDQAYGLAIDASGSVTIAGYTSSTDFPTVSAVRSSFQGGNTDGFVSTLNPAGSALVHSTYLGGSGDDLIYAVASGGGRTHVTGYTTSPDFPLTHDPVQAAPGGGYDAFAASLVPGTLAMSTYLGGSGTDYGLATAASGLSFFVVGQTDSVNFRTVSAMQPAPGGGDDAFVARFVLDAQVPASDGRGALVLTAALALVGAILLMRRRRVP